MATACDLPIFLLLLLLVPSQLSGQEDATQVEKDDLSSSPTSYAGMSGLTPTTGTMIAILILAFFITALFFFYLHRRRVAYVNSQLLLQNLGHNASLPGNNAAGLDQSIIETFPTMVYSDVKGLKLGNSPLECAVCLCEFEDQEELTLLPNCNHAFHTNCINEWFTSHSTCPVCRDDLRILSPRPVARIGGTLGGVSESREEVADHLGIRVDEAGELTRAGSKNRVGSRVLRTWRSRSARPAALGDVSRMTTTGKIWGEEERERFTLRLPENIRNGLMERTTSSSSLLRRSASVTAPRAPFPGVGEESPRTGYSNRGGGGIYWGGRSVKRPSHGLATLGV